MSTRSGTRGDVGYGQLYRRFGDFDYTDGQNMKMGMSSEYDTRKQVAQEGGEGRERREWIRTGWKNWLMCVVDDCTANEKWEGRASRTFSITRRLGKLGENGAAFASKIRKHVEQRRL